MIKFGSQPRFSTTLISVHTIDIWVFYRKITQTHFKFNIHLSLSYFKQNVESFLPVTQFQHGVAFLLCYVSAVWM